MSLNLLAPPERPMFLVAALTAHIQSAQRSPHDTPSAAAVPSEADIPTATDRVPDTVRQRETARARAAFT